MKNEAPRVKARGLLERNTEAATFFWPRMYKRGRSFVTIMLVVALSALFLRTAIERIIKVNISQNEPLALSTLKIISAALENYAKDNQGIYPKSLSVLSQANPPYLDKDYIAQSPLKGYSYACMRLEPSGYSCSATPSKCRISGNAAYTISTGGLLVSEECSKKE